MSKVFAPIGRMVEKIRGKTAPKKLDAILTRNERESPLHDPADIFGHRSRGQEEEAAEAERARIAAIPPPRPLPDEEEMARNRRKNKARSRSTGRASTILSDEAGDYLGG